MPSLSSVRKTQGVAVVLAAGSSSRFGSDKRQACIDGKTMLARSLQPYTALFNEVFVVVRPSDDILDTLGANIKTIEAPTAYLGMGHSLATAAKALDGVPWMLVGLADMPWIKEKTIKLIKDSLDQATNAIVRPVFEKRPGHPVGFTVNFLPKIAKLEGDEGAKTLVEKYRKRVVELAVSDSGILRDVDRPAHLNSDS